MHRQVFPSGTQGTQRPFKLHTIEKLGASNWSSHFKVSFMEYTKKLWI